MKPLLLMLVIPSLLFSQSTNPMPEISLSTIDRGWNIVHGRRVMDGVEPDRIDGRRYELTLQLTFLHPSTLIDGPIGVIIVMPGRSVVRQRIDQTHLIHRSPLTYEYVFPLIVRMTGWAELFVVPVLDVNDTTRPSDYALTSNRENFFMTDKP